MAATALVLGVLSTFASAPPIARAQNSGWGPAPGNCVPACRSGYECEAGECLPVCDPPCGPGFICADGGQCLAQPGGAPGAGSAPTSGPSGACVPACRTGFVCVHGACITACNPPCPTGYTCTPGRQCVLEERQPDEAGEPEPKKAEEKWTDAQSSNVNVHMDILGLLQFGVSPTLELGATGAFYIRLRPLNTGLMSYLLLPGDDEDTFVWGMGGDIGFHLFAGKDGNMRGFFGGLGLGYYYAETEDVESAMATFSTHALVPQLDLGYRWAFDRLLLGFGGRLGLSIPIDGSHTEFGFGSCPFPDECDDDRALFVVPTLFLHIGWLL